MLMVWQVVIAIAFQTLHWCPTPGLLAVGGGAYSILIMQDVSYHGIACCLFLLHVSSMPQKTELSQTPRQWTCWLRSGPRTDGSNLQQHESGMPAISTNTALPSYMSTASHEHVHIVRHSLQLLHHDSAETGPTMACMPVG